MSAWTRLCVLWYASVLRYSRASRLTHSLSGYNKLGDKKMYAKQHYYALSMRAESFSVALPCRRLIIKRWHKISVTHFFLARCSSQTLPNERSCYIWRLADFLSCFGSLSVWQYVEAHEFYKRKLVAAKRLPGLCTLLTLKRSGWCSNFSDTEQAFGFD